MEAVQDYYTLADTEGFREAAEADAGLGMPDFYSNVEEKVHGLFKEELRQQLPRNAWDSLA